MRPYASYLSQFCTCLAGFRQKLQPHHPLFRTQSGLSREVMKMSDQPFNHPFQTGIRAEGIDCVDILRDVICRKIHHWWYLVLDFDCVVHIFTGSVGKF